MTEELVKKLYSRCTLCPRKCCTDRYSARGFCNADTEPKVARAALHMWEEPVLGGTAGSGAVFFSDCTLRCVFCQNCGISAGGFGKTVSTGTLSDIFLRLIEQGAANLDLVTPTHYLPSVLAALDKVRHRINVPVVYNCGGYENVETIRLLNGYVDIYLPDIKYFSDELAVKYSQAPHYFETAVSALSEMISQTGAPLYDDAGSPDRRLLRGVIVRHMVLPGHRNDSKAVLTNLAHLTDVSSFLISLLSQYTPFYKVLTEPRFKHLNRRVMSYEYDEVVDTALKLGMDGFMQEKSSARGEYTPDFNLEGVN